MSNTPAVRPASAELASPAGVQFERVETDTTRSLEAWASDLEHAFALAEKLCQTMFVPQHFRGKPADGAAAILYGETLEMPPMIALRTIYVVHGTPALYAQQMFAIAVSKGHEIERVYADDARVEFRCRRRGSKEWQRVEWTIERAERAKYTSNPKYRENPIGMLTEKCKAEAAKLVAPDALAGMSSVEEIQLGDFEDLGETPAPAAPAAATTITRKPKAQAAERPARPAPAPAPAPAADAPENNVAEPNEPVDTSTGEVMPEATDEMPVDFLAECETRLGDKTALAELGKRARAAGASEDIIGVITEAWKDAA